jgi:hypothetical protein
MKIYNDICILKIHDLCTSCQFIIAVLSIGVISTNIEPINRSHFDRLNYLNNLLVVFIFVKRMNGLLIMSSLS